MPIQTQLSVFLKNKPGVMARLCRSLAEVKINILAICVSDTVDHAVVRLIVSEPVKARNLFEQTGVLVVETPVLALELPNQPGVLETVARKLSRAGINIEYAYGTAGREGEGSLLIMRVDRLLKARQVLKA